MLLTIFGITMVTIALVMGSATISWKLQKVHQLSKGTSRLLAPFLLLLGTIPPTLLLIWSFEGYKKPTVICFAGLVAVIWYGSAFLLFIKDIKKLGEN